MEQQIRRILKLKSKKESAQGMVEFALVLPLLLVLALGIIEAGRLLVIYTSVMAASREATRYASAAGKSERGLPYYLDTVGIEAAAGRIAVLTGASTVEVTYDSGPGTAEITLSSPPRASDLALGDRVTVRVEAPFTPFFGLTAISSFPVSSTTSRTILKNVSIYENEAPYYPIEVIITSPTTFTFEYGEPIHFVAVASHYIGALNWQWASSIDGILNASDTFDKDDLSPNDANCDNPHTISVTVTDSTGAVASDVITICISGNAPPEVIITSPPDVSSFEEGQIIHFTATALDNPGPPGDGDMSATLQWTTSDGGPGGSGASFDYAFSAQGWYEITATSVPNSGGLTGSATIHVTIGAKQPPVVTITYPANGSTFATNTDITFTGTANDVKDGNLSAGISWTSSDGGSGSGASFIHRFANPGTYSITASVTDSDTLSNSASITIYIAADTPPVVTIQPSSLTCNQNQTVNLYRDRLG